MKEKLGRIFGKIRKGSGKEQETILIEASSLEDFIIKARELGATSVSVSPDTNYPVRQKAIPPSKGINETRYEYGTGYEASTSAGLLRFFEVFGHRTGVELPPTYKEAQQQREQREMMALRTVYTAEIRRQHLMEQLQGVEISLSISGSIINADTRNELLREAHQKNIEPFQISSPGPSSDTTRI